MAKPPILEGTWEELKLHDAELSGKRYRLVPLPSETVKTTTRASKSKRSTAPKPGAQAPRQLTGMGKFAGIIPSSEEFIRQKQEEIKLEERKFRG